VLTVLEVLAEDRGIQIKIVASGSSALPVTEDRGLIRSAVMNVVHNAIKFSPPDSVVTVPHSVTSEREGFKELTLQDQGPGAGES